jgi:hypothetical protein
MQRWGASRGHREARSNKVRRKLAMTRSSAETAQSAVAGRKLLRGCFEEGKPAKVRGEGSPMSGEDITKRAVFS